MTEERDTLKAVVARLRSYADNWLNVDILELSDTMVAAADALDTLTDSGADVERVADALYDHCHEAEHGECFPNVTEKERDYWRSFARAAIAALRSTPNEQATTD